MNPTRAALERMLAAARATVAEIEAEIALVDLTAASDEAVGPEWSTPQQAAAALGVHESTVTDWLRSERLRGMKRGGRWLVHRSAISAWAALRPAL